MRSCHRQLNGPLLVLVAGVVAACNGSDTDPDAGLTGVTTDVAEDNGICVPASRRAAGGCCPAGHAWLNEVGKCVRMGPLACADAVGDPAGCTPRWCGDWRDEEGAPCDATQFGCWLKGRPCTTDELATGGGCRAGWWPDPSAGGSCHPVGRSAASKDAPALDEVGLVEIPDLPEPTTITWCWNAATQAGATCQIGSAGCRLTPRPCTDHERRTKAGCSAGMWPDPTGDCVAPGVDWTCPPGFVVEGVAAGDDATCVADPADCGNTPWNGLSGPGVLHVNAAAKSGGNGKVTAPYNDLKMAIKAAPTGATIAIAAGTYDGAIVIDRPLTLRGRCAAMVHLTAGSGAVVKIDGPATAALTRLEGLHLSGTAVGLDVQKGPRVAARRLWLQGLRQAGVQLGAGGVAKVEESVIRDVKSAALVAINGQGIVARGGALAELRQLRVDHVDHAGLQAMDSNTWVRGEDVAIYHCRRLGTWEASGSAVVALTGAEVDLQRATLAQTTGRGALSGEKGAMVRLTGVSIRGVTPDAKADVGRASIDVTNGAHAVIAGVEIADNGAMGIRAGGGGGSLVVGGAWIRDSTPHTWIAADGLGVVAWGQAQVTLIGSRIERTRLYGLLVMDAGTEAYATDVLISHVQPGPGSDQGAGIDVRSSARLLAQRVRLHRNRRRALIAWGQGTSLRARGLVIDGTHVIAPEYDLPAGMWVGPGAHVRLLDARMSGNVWSSLTVAGGTVEATGLLLDYTHFGKVDTKDRETGKVGAVMLGFGARAGAGSVLRLWGARSSRTFGAGVTAAGQDTILEARGLTVDHTAYEVMKKVWGMGLLVADGAESHVAESLITANHVAGAWAYASTLRMTDSVVTHTRPGGRKQSSSPESAIADGVMATTSAKLEMERCVVTALPRAGVLAYDGASALLRANVITNCGFGVSTQSGGEADATGNAIWANLIHNISSDGGLDVPPPPSAVIEP